MKTRSNSRFLAASPILLALSIGSAHAQSVWTGSTDSVFSTGTNFSPAIANTAVSNLDIQFDGTDATTADLTLALAFGGNAGGAGSVYTVLSSQTNPLTITGSGSAAMRISSGLTVQADAGAVTLAGVGNLAIGGITSATSHEIRNLSSNLLDLGSWLVISGGGGARSLTVETVGDIISLAEWRNSLSPLPSTNPLSLDKTGAGKLTLGGTNTFSGNTLVSAGVLELTNSLALQNSALDTSGAGTLTVTGPTTLTIGGLAGGTNLASVITTGYSGITELALNPRSGTQTYSGNITNGAAGMNLVKSGGGTQVLSGTNTHTGSTAISAGTLRLGAAGALGNGTNNTTGVAVNGTGGIFDLAGITPTATVPLTLNSTANGFDVGSFTNSSGGTATYAGDIDLQAATVRAGATSPNHMTLTGTLTGNDKNFTKDGSNIMTLTGSGTVSLGILRVFRGTLLLDAGTTLNPIGDFFLGGGTSVATTLTLNGGSLTVPAAQTATFGAGAGSAASTVNLNSGTLTVPKLTKGTQNFSVNFNGGTLTANADSTSFLTAIGGSAKVLTGGALINDDGFAITIGQALIDDTIPTGGGLAKSGLGTLTLAGANTYTGNTSVNAGTLDLADTGALKFVPTAPGVTNKVTGPGTADFNGTFNIDLANADTTDGNAWVLADVFSQSFDSATFTVSGFTESPEGTWTLLDGTKIWIFTQGDATLRLSAGFANWIDDFGLALADQDPTDDPDNDGMDNLLEFVLNGNPSVSDSAILPDLVVTATDFEFTYQRRDDSVSPETTQTFQWGTTLASWPNSVVVTAGGGSFPPATVTVTPGVPSDAVTDTVKISIPKSEDGGSGKLFGRLQVVKP